MARVLVIDDEAPIRLLCRVNLEAAGIEVSEAEDGNVGLESARAEPPDVILLDVMMPGMDGWQVFSELLNDERTANVPIVFTGATDPVANGFVASLSRPGGNMTGLTLADTKVTGKRLSLLKEAIPKLNRVAILSNPANSAQPLAIRDVKVAARSLGVQLQLLEARGPNDFDGLDAHASSRPDRPILP